jgi:hypothetical protein
MRCLLRLVKIHLVAFCLMTECLNLIYFILLDQPNAHEIYTLQLYSFINTRTRFGAVALYSESSHQVL